MRSNGLATILLLIPVLTVPALAIFGIPQFAPVVASPLDEGQEKEKESRVGSSARQSRDDLFGDVEEFGGEPAAQDDLSSHRRDSQAVTNSNRQGSSRRAQKSARKGWSDDLDTEADWPSRSPRRPPPEFDDTSEPSRSNGRSPKKTMISDRSSRDARREFDNGNVDAIRVASAGDEDQGIVPAGFEQQSAPERSRDAIKANRSRNEAQPSSLPDYPNEDSQSRSVRPESRSRLKDPRGSQRREMANEPLTWQAAVERLNKLDIRNFRLEPGHQQGQFVFICSYTPPDNPRVSYRFEAGADEPLKAVEKVLEQIIEWQQNR